MILSALGEKLDRPKVIKIIEEILPLLKHPNSKVRYAVIQTIAVFSLDLNVNVRSELHNLLIPPLIKVINDPVPKVAAHSLGGLINICENLPIEILGNYLDELAPICF